MKNRMDDAPCDLCDLTCSVLGKTDKDRAECKKLLKEMSEGIIDDKEFEDRMRAKYGDDWMQKVHEAAQE